MMHSRLEVLRDLAGDHALPLRVRGTCMAPLVRDGALVVLAGPKRVYWPGDVVVRGGTPGLLIHRVIGVYWRAGRLHYLTQGDAAAHPDAAVTACQILGPVRGGDCSGQLVRVPLRHRCWALWRFGRFMAARLGRERPWPRWGRVGAASAATRPWQSVGWGRG
ncbi:S24/S26 family peptidase [uncultured Thiodictyon sp.]|uniref:S24/S26 family peptidase n=1 Tax=uncultured Thiodictyon sp. TaxID=1846217 RepID=UPI0025D6FE76|nr:S24/S26 family peptidase [uncultured Thiodictyon sp.]